MGGAFGCSSITSLCDNCDHRCERYEGYEQGCKDERRKIMEIVDSADDMAQAMYLLGQYIIGEELKE